MIFLKKVSLVLLICAYCFGCTNNKQSESRVADSVATDTIQDANSGTIDSKEETTVQPEPTNEVVQEVPEAFRQRVFCHDQGP